MMLTAKVDTSVHLASARSFLAIESIAEIVQHHFSLGPVAECGLLSSGLNDVYYLHFASGADKICRISRVRSRGAPNIAYELSLLQHLKRAGVSVAVPPHRTRERRSGG